MSRFLDQLGRLLPQSRLFRSIFLLSGSTAIAQLITICALPLVTRLYTPAEIGLLSLFLSFIGFWVNTIALRYEHSLIIAADDAESHVVHRLATFLVFLMSILGVSTLWLLLKFNVFEFQQLPVWTPLIALPVLIGTGLSLVYRSWALRAGLLRQISQAGIARSASLAGTKITLGIFSAGVLGLLVAELIGAMTSLAQLMRSTHAHFASTKPKHIRIEDMRHVGAKFSKFPKMEMPSAWLDSLSMLLPVPLVATLYGIEAAGWFGLARMVVSLPNAQIGAAVADVFQIELAKAILDNNQQRARDLFFSLFKKMGLIGLLPLVGSVLVLPWAFPFIFGRDWEAAGLISASLSPWLYAAFVISPLSRALSVLQAQEWKFFYDILALGFLLVCYFLATPLAVSLIEFCLLVSVAQAVCYVVYAIVLYMLVENRLKKPQIE